MMANDISAEREHCQSEAQSSARWDSGMKYVGTHVDERDVDL